LSADGVVLFVLYSSESCLPPVDLSFRAVAMFEICCSFVA